MSSSVNSLYPLMRQLHLVNCSEVMKNICFGVWENNEYKYVKGLSVRSAVYLNHTIDPLTVSFHSSFVRSSFLSLCDCTTSSFLLPCKCFTKFHQLFPFTFRYVQTTVSFYPTILLSAVFFPSTKIRKAVSVQN